jgi:5-methylcytosine-specific restriction protein A
MPNAPERLCAHIGCKVFVSKGRCDKHRKKEQRDYDKYQRNLEAKKFYQSKQWQALREQCRQEAFGLCAECNKAGRLKQGSAADHIVPREQGGGDAIENLQYLCGECHSRKSAEEGSRWGTKKESAQG